MPEIINHPQLGFYPTPLVHLKHLSKALNGPQILMKRDDQTGLAFGGNKTRKLEHLIADALAQGADTVITAGAQQSNHCRQTAAACAAVGLKCHLVLGGTEPAIANGNFLLDRILGANIHFTGDQRKGESLTDIAIKLRQEGFRPYIIPYGGSNGIGARGFVDAVAEVKLQLQEWGAEVDRIIFASSSGGTQAGLMVGKLLRNFRAEILGIAIDKDEIEGKPFVQQVVDVANETASLLKIKERFTIDEVKLKENYVGAGYGIVGELEKEAIYLTASLEGILVDPVYTGRAMGALIDMVRTGEIKKNEIILFWHTGGSPALFSYAADLV